MVVDMYYRHNFYCGDCYFWSLDPASPDSDVDETLCGPVPFLLPDSFTVHFSCGRHYFRCDGDYVYDFSDGYGVTDYIVKEDVARSFQDAVIIIVSILMIASCLHVFLFLLVNFLLLKLCERFMIIDFLACAVMCRLFP